MLHTSFTRRALERHLDTPRALEGYSKGIWALKALKATWALQGLLGNWVLEALYLADYCGSWFASAIDTIIRA